MKKLVWIGQISVLQVFFYGDLERRVNNHGRNLRKSETALSKEEASEDILKLLINREWKAVRCEYRPESWQNEPNAARSVQKSPRADFPQYGGKQAWLIRYLLHGWKCYQNCHDHGLKKHRKVKARNPEKESWNAKANSGFQKRTPQKNHQKNLLELDHSG